MEGDIGKKSKDKYLEFNGVRITPKALILKNAYEGKFFREKIVLQNVSFKPVTIRTRDPTSFVCVVLIIRCIIDIKNVLL